MDRLYKALQTYGNSDAYPFHMPGHKRNRGMVHADLPFKEDITEISGFDNLHHACGILKEAQERTARLYGVKQSFFSVNGSTACLLAAISAVVPFGSRILMARNCHKAVYHAVFLRNLQPVYLYPETGRDGINGEIRACDVRKALDTQKDIKAVILTSPSYDGIVSDIREIAEAAHAKSLPLIVDAAHGAHFAFSDYFPQPAERLGADLVIMSTHKTLPAMTQTALLHVCSDLISPEKLAFYMGVYETSSPSYILMSSIDACMERLEKDGKELFDRFTQRLEMCRRRMAGCEKIRLFEPERTSCGYDRSKLVFMTGGTGMNGFLLHGYLRDRYGIEMEMAAVRYALGIASVGDTENGFLRLEKAMEELDRECEKKTEEKETMPGNIRLDCALSVTRAMESTWEETDLASSAGRISCEFLYVYPPGIPLIVPGEVISEEILEVIGEYRRIGMETEGTADLSGEKIRIVRQDGCEWERLYM